MSQTTPNQATAANKKAYHTPQLRKFGKVSELTFTTGTNNATAYDGGTFPMAYTS